MKLSIELKIESEADFQGICTAIEMLETLQAKYRHRYVAQEKMSPDDSQRVASSLAQKLGHYSRPDPRNKGAMDELSNTMDITSPDFFFGSKK